MRRVSADFLGDTQRHERFSSFAREACQIVLGMNAGPKHARRMRIRKEAELLDGDGDGLPRGQRTERTVQLRQSLLRPLPAELRGDVQIARRAPVDLCSGLEPLEQAFQIRDHFQCEIDADEQSHFAAMIIVQWNGATSQWRAVFCHGHSMRGTPWKSRAGCSARSWCTGARPASSPKLKPIWVATIWRRIPRAASPIARA